MPKKTRPARSPERIRAELEHKARIAEMRATLTATGLNPDVAERLVEAQEAIAEFEASGLEPIRIADLPPDEKEDWLSGRARSAGATLVSLSGLTREERRRAVRRMLGTGTDD